MKPDADSQGNQNNGSSVTLETIIAMGLFGWLALSMTLMGLGVW